jgi:hypothetical protein
MSTVCFPPTHGYPHRMVSGSDEKLLRVFDAPECFLRMLRGVDGSASEAHATLDDVVLRVEQAFSPELALSNKVRSAECGGLESFALLPSSVSTPGAVLSPRASGYHKRHRDNRLR